VVARVELHPNPRTGERSAHRVRLLEHADALPVLSPNPDDSGLRRRENGRKAQTLIVAVRHDHGADHPRRKAPARRVAVLPLVVFVDVLDVETLREVRPEIMAPPPPTA